MEREVRSREDDVGEDGQRERGWLVVFWLIDVLVVLLSCDP